MSHELDPKVGRWYRRLDDEQIFKVASIDEDDGLIEIKTVEGEVEELDSTEWIELDLEIAEAPTGLGFGLCTAHPGGNELLDALVEVELEFDGELGVDAPSGPGKPEDAFHVQRAAAGRAAPTIIPTASV